MAYNPSAIRIQRMLGASKTPRPAPLPQANFAPKLGSQINDRMLMRPGRQGGGATPVTPFPTLQDAIAQGSGTGRPAPTTQAAMSPRDQLQGMLSGPSAMNPSGNAAVGMSEWGGFLPSPQPGGFARGGRIFRAEGGGIQDSPSSPFTGGIMSAGAGRADDVPMHVPDGAYVVPAWAVSHMGEGNTINGMSQLKMMFGSPWGAQKAPFGAPSPQLKVGKGVAMPHSKPPPFDYKPPWLVPGMSPDNPALQGPGGMGKQAHGGVARSSSNGAVPINASGGEFVIKPDEVAKMGDGNVDKGHLILDKWVVTLKKEAADTLKRLPGPAK